MKKIIIAWVALSSVSAFASLESQMQWVQGAWDGGKYVIKVEKQAYDEISILRCNRNSYFNSNGRICKYDFKLTGHYHSRLDAFYIPPIEASGTVARGVCSFSLYHDPFYTA